MNPAMVFAAGLSLSLTSGPAGAQVTVTGSGFGVSETGISITFDSVVIVSGITANTGGGWSGTLTIPTAAYGNHSVGAFGANTTAASVPVVSFFVLNPNITINQSTGPSGTPVTVSGTGFAPSETGITITFDGNALITGLVATTLGNWSGTFSVPSGSSGFHSVSAYGAITQAGFVPNLNFTVVNPAITINKNGGPPGTLVNVNGTGFSSGETGITVTFDGTSVSTLVSANLQGAWSSTFTVPAAVGGVHNVSAYGSITRAGTVGSVSFVVNPAISASQTSSIPGSQVTMNGAGFGANEAGITLTYDGVAVASNIAANAQGSWRTNFTVPLSASGSHAVTAFGSITLASSVTAINYLVGPGITISQSSGAPGIQITVTGAGFGGNEGAINITYDGTSVTSGIAADSQGSWKGTFTVPSSVAGAHTVSAFGTTTLVGSTQGVTFTLNSGVTLSQANGAPGAQVTVTGSGFASNEGGITITYDGTPVATGITANNVGNWSGTFTVPASSSGSHKVQAYGLITQASQVAAANFKISQAISINPASGFVGKPVTVSGLGFVANSPVTITYDNQDLTVTGASTDINGNFSVTFNAPPSTGGSHSITVTDGQKNSAKVAFTMDSTPPPVPSPVSPKDGGRAGFLGGSTPTFSWSAVTDQSGVTYTLEVDISPDFASPVLQKAGLTVSRYTLTAAESLSYGKYYWRVQAVDGASNASAWSSVRLVKSGLMMAWVFAVILIIVLGVIGSGVYFLLRRRKPKARPVVVTGVETPQTVQGEWRMIENEPSAEQSQLPYRLALPAAPAKRGKTISTEDQARLKVIIDFAKSLPLVEPDFNADWLTELIENYTGAQMSEAVYEKLFLGELDVKYDPTWMHHPAYQDLTALLQKQAVLQDLNTFVGDTNQLVADAISILQQIYREAKADLPADFLPRGGWWFTKAVYTDAVSWFAGKSLREPSERDYSIKSASETGGEAGERWLFGEPSTPFEGELILVTDDTEFVKFRSLHIALRRNWRSNEKARQVAAMITRIQLQRSRLLNTFNQFDRFKL
jgi:hypothetical protein